MSCVDLLYAVCDVWKNALLESLAMTERSEMGLYEVSMFMSLLGFGMGIMFANHHICGMMLFNPMMYNVHVVDVCESGCLNLTQ